MNDEDNKTPEEVADADLDGATGGLSFSPTRLSPKILQGSYRRTLTAASGIDNIGDAGQTDTVVADMSIKTTKR